MSTDTEKTGDDAGTGGDASTSIVPDAADLPPASGLDEGDATLGADLEPADELVEEPAAEPETTFEPLPGWKNVSVSEAGRTKPFPPPGGEDDKATVIETGAVTDPKSKSDAATMMVETKPDDEGTDEPELAPNPNPAKEPTMNKKPDLVVPPRRPDMPARKESGTSALWWAPGIAAILLIGIAAWLLSNGNQPATKPAPTAPVVTVDPDAHLVMDYTLVPGQIDHRGNLFAGATGDHIRCSQMEPSRSTGELHGLRGSCVKAAGL